MQINKISDHFPKSQVISTSKQRAVEKRTNVNIFEKKSISSINQINNISLSHFEAEYQDTIKATSTSKKTRTKIINTHLDFIFFRFFLRCLILSSLVQRVEALNLNLGKGNMAHRPIFYDTETTGLRAKKDRIIEIAAFDPVRNLRFEKFVNPGCPIPPKASAIHHITDDMVASAPSFAQIATEFIDFCKGNVILIAHNNDNFDIHFLRNEFQRHNILMPPWKSLDSLKWARRCRPDLPRHNLQFLREIYGIAANNVHRALDDAIVLYQIFQSLTEDLHIDDVYSLLNRAHPIQNMPFGKHQGQPLIQLPRSYIQWLSSSKVLDKHENQELKQNFQRLGLLADVEERVV